MDFAVRGVHAHPTSNIFNIRHSSNIHRYFFLRPARAGSPQTAGYGKRLSP